MALDVEKIRADFPILNERPHGQRLAFLDSAASAQKPRHVIERIETAYLKEYANVHRGLYHFANQSTYAYEQARSRVADFIHAPSAEEIVFTRSTTESINLVAAAFGQIAIEPGDEIVLSVIEHHANVVPWHFLRAQKGAVLKWIMPDENGIITQEAFEAALSERTKIVAITHMSNVMGHLLPLESMIKAAHTRNIPVLVDGTQAVVHEKIDVQALDCDFYVFTGHKLYGPTGIGVLYGKKEWLSRLPPVSGGGEMIERVTLEDVTYEAPPLRFEAGTPPFVQAIGLAAALDYMESVGREAISDHEHMLTNYAYEQLGQMPFIKLYGLPDPSGRARKGPIVAFDVEGVHPHDVATILDQTGVAIRAGTHCAMPLCTQLGVSALCRASFGMYNTIEEIDILVTGLKKVVEIFQHASKRPGGI